MGAQTIATRDSVGSKFKIVAKMDSRSTQEIVKYIKKAFTKNVVEEVELDEEVADLFVQDKVGSNHQVQIALKIKGLAKKLGLRTGSVGNQVRVMGPKKTVTQFMRSILGKSSLGNPTEKGASDSQTNRELKKQLREENELDEGRMKELHMYIGQGKSAEWIAKKMKLDVKTVKALMSEEKLDEAKFEIVYVKKGEMYSKTIDARNEDDAENKAIKKWKIKADDIRTVAKESKLIDKPTGKVLKTGSKEEMETERKRNRDELQVKEWFKSKGINVIGLGVGEPDFKTPEHIIDAGIRAMHAGKTRYTAAAGIPELHEAILEKLKRDNHIDCNIENIIVS